MAAPSLLAADDLCIEYPTRDGTVAAVNGVSLEIRQGEVLGLVGDSGSGKSTLALALVKLARPPGRIVSGRIQFDGHDLLSMRERDLRDIRGRDISMISQNPRAALNPLLRIGTQIVHQIRAHSHMSRGEAKERAIRMLRLVGINDPARRINAYPHELSGGMAQRAVIAKALSCVPRILIADEPTSGLDVTIQAQILDDLARTTQETGSSILIVTHELGVVANYCDRVIVMYGGQIVESGQTERIFRQPSHPATKALLSLYSEDEQVQLTGPGLDLRQLPSGCYLHPRCPWADRESCVHDRQELREIEPDHFVRCHRWREVLNEHGDDPRIRAGSL